MASWRADGRRAIALLAAVLLLAGCPGGGNQVKPPGKNGNGKPAANGTKKGTPTPVPPLGGRVLSGVAIGAASGIIANNGGAFISENGGAFISENGGAFISENGGAIIANNGSGLVSDQGGGLIGANGSGIIANNGGGLIGANGSGLVSKTKYGLQQALPFLKLVAKARVELIDAAGKPLAPAVETDDKGQYRLTLPGALPPVAFVRVSYSEGAIPVRLTAAAELKGTDSRTVDLTPSTTLVAKKVEALIGKSLVPGQDFSVAGVREATEAVAGFMSDKAVVGACVTDTQRAELLFDAMMGAAPKLRATVQEIGQRTGIPFVIGQSNLGDAGKATDTTLGLPVALALDPREPGAFVVADRGGNRLRRVSADGRITTIAGTGKKGGAGDGGPAVKAELDGIADVLYGKDGTLWLAEEDARTVRRIRPDGVIETVIGTYGANAAFTEEDTSELRAVGLLRPSRLAWDADERGLFIADREQNKIWRLDVATMKLVRFAGDRANQEIGIEAGDGRPARTSGIERPNGLAVDTSTTPATLYFSEKSRARIRRVKPDGTLETLKLAGEAGFVQPSQLAVQAGKLYVSDQAGHRVAAIDLADPALTVRTVVGAAGQGGTGEETGSATEIRVSNPEEIVFDAQGRLLVCDSRHGLVRAVPLDGGPAVNLAGTLVKASAIADRSKIVLNRPLYAVVDKDQNVLIGDAGTGKVLKLAPDNALTTIAGSGERDSKGDGGLATAAGFKEVGGLAFDAQGRLLVADTGGGGRIRRIDQAGVITTIAEDFNPPAALAVDSKGTIYVAEPNRNRVSAIAPDGTRSVLIGEDGPAGKKSDGDGGPAAAAHVHFPTGLVVDAQDNLYVCEMSGGKIRKIELGKPDKPVSTFMAGLLKGGAAPFAAPSWLAFDLEGRAVVVDFGGKVVRREADGTFTTLAGPDGRVFNGDGVDDGLQQPSCVVFERDGAMWIVDSGNNQLKYVPAASMK